MKAPNTFTEESPLGRQDLVDLAREILSTSREGGHTSQTSRTMSKMANQDDGEKQAESPTARFTAVNGRDQNGSAHATNGNGSSNGVNGSALQRRGSDDRVNGHQRVSPPGHE